MKVYSSKKSYLLTLTSLLLLMIFDPPTILLVGFIFLFFAYKYRPWSVLFEILPSGLKIKDRKITWNSIRSIKLWRSRQRDFIKLEIKYSKEDEIRLQKKSIRLLAVSDKQKKALFYEILKYFDIEAEAGCFKENFTYNFWIIVSIIVIIIAKINEWL